jgi:hypothetical protein
MSNVIPLPRSAPPAGGDAPFDEAVPVPGAESAAETEDRFAGGGGGGGEAAEDDGCPLTPLGHLDGRHFFFDPRGQIRELNAQQIGQRSHLDVLLCGEIAWAVRVAPAFDREGKPTGDYSQKEVARHLIRLNDRVGLMHDRPRRGPGVWRSAAGVPLLHLGDVVVSLRDGVPSSCRAGFLAAGALWPAFPVVLPAEDGRDRLAWLTAPASAAEAYGVEQVFARWNWGANPQAGVMFGLWAAHLLGAAVRWRPHGLVVGPPGSGKTTLMEAYDALSPLSVFLNDFTEAGLRQMLTGRAQPLLLDEAEGDADGVARLQRVIELLRRASGGAGAQSVRGSAGGQSQRFEVMSPAMLGAVLPPTLLPQDASRITRLDLHPRAPGGQPLPSAAEMVALRALAPRLWGRALAGLGRMAANAEVYRRVLMARGCAPRMADQLGTILAARAMMLRDAPTDEAEADEDVGRFGWLAVSEADQAPDAGPMACLTHLLQSALDMTYNGERPTVGEAIRRAHAEDAENWRRWLAEHGMLLAPWPRDGGGHPCLLVADKHPRMGRIFDGTAWAGSRWKEDLRRLPGAVVPEHPQRIGSAKPRCTVIPAPLLPDPVSDAAASFTAIEDLAAEFELSATWQFRAAKARFTPAQARADAEREARGRG